MSDPLSPGHAVGLLEGETEVWPTLALAPVGTTVSDNEGQEWARFHTWWGGPDGARITSPQLGKRGPLRVRKVHEHEWIELATFGSRNVQCICACGAKEERPR